MLLYHITDVISIQMKKKTKWASDERPYAIKNILEEIRYSTASKQKSPLIK